MHGGCFTHKSLTYLLTYVPYRTRVYLAGNCPVWYTRVLFNIVLRLFIAAVSDGVLPCIAGDTEGWQADGHVGRRRTCFAASQVCFLPQGHGEDVRLSITGQDHPVPGLFSHSPVQSSPVSHVLWQKYSLAEKLFRRVCRVWDCLVVTEEARTNRTVVAR